MSYQTIMVHLQLGRPNTSMLRVASELAQSFHSNIIGIACGQQTQKLYGQGYPLLNILNPEHANLNSEIADAEMLFRDAFKAWSAGEIEWRSSATSMSCATYLASECGSTDLLITESVPTDFYEGPNRVTAGEMILQAGRPVIVVPATTSTTRFENILIGWKDVREARRSILDALPLLKLAKRVTLVEITSKEQFPQSSQNIKKIINWLSQHKIYASFENIVSKGDDPAQFIEYANTKAIDLIVAGAYGHSLVSEWMFGGVTNELLRSTNLCSFLSH